MDCFYDLEVLPSGQVVHWQGASQKYDGLLRTISAAHPDSLFTLTISPKAGGCARQLYFKGGLMQEAKLTLLFEPFNETKLA